MARPRSAKKGPNAKQRPASPLPSDMEDEVDKFHKQRDKLALNLEDEALTDDDSLDEEEVLGMDGSEEYDTDDEIEAETKYGKRECPAVACGISVRPSGHRAAGWSTQGGEV